MAHLKPLLKYIILLSGKYKLIYLFLLPGLSGTLPLFHEISTYLYVFVQVSVRLIIISSVLHNVVWESPPSYVQKDDAKPDITAVLHIRLSPMYLVIQLLRSCLFPVIIPT